MRSFWIGKAEAEKIFVAYLVTKGYGQKDNAMSATNIKVHRRKRMS